MKSRLFSTWKNKTTRILYKFLYTMALFLTKCVL